MRQERQRAKRNTIYYFLLPTACWLLQGLPSPGTFADESKFIDCSLLVAPDYPSTWPSNPFPRFLSINEGVSRTLLFQVLKFLSENILLERMAQFYDFWNPFAH